MASDNYAQSNENKNLVIKAEALKKVYEHNRDYLSVKLKIPLGNTELSKVHTNQFLFTNLPKEFDLFNWTVIADALNSNTNRFEQYVKNKWYIEGIDTTVEAGGKAEMELSLNAFPSSEQSYKDDFKSLEEEWNNTFKKNNNNTINKNKSTAVTNKKSIINQKWVKKYNIPQVIINIVKKICKTSQTDEQNVKAIFKYMDKNINYISYSNHQHDFQWQINHRGGNCVDNSRFFCACCRAIGIKCNFIKNRCISHQYNKVYIKGKGIIVDVGRQLASWGSHWGSGGCPQESETSW